MKWNIKYAKNSIFEILAYALASVKKCKIYEYWNNCIYIKSIFWQFSNYMTRWDGECIKNNKKW